MISKRIHDLTAIERNSKITRQKTEERQIKIMFRRIAQIVW